MEGRIVTYIFVDVGTSGESNPHRHFGHRDGEHGGQQGNTDTTSHAQHTLRNTRSARYHAFNIHHHAAPRSTTQHHADNNHHEQVHRVFVVDEDDKPVCVLSMKDVLNEFLIVE